MLISSLKKLDHALRNLPKLTVGSGPFQKFIIMLVFLLCVCLFFVFVFLLACLFGLICLFVCLFVCFQSHFSVD